MIGFIGCGSEESSKTLDGEETETTVKPQVILSEVLPEDQQGGIGLVISDLENTERMGFEIKGDGNGNIEGVSKLYYANEENQNVTISLNSANLPEKVVYANGTEIRISNHTASSMDVSFYQDGIYLEGPYTIQVDLSDIMQISDTLSSQNKMMRKGWNVQSACSWFPNGGCKNMYWWGSQILSAVGCGTAIATAAGATAVSGGTLSALAVPAAVGTCSSLVVSISSDVLYDKTDEKIFVATGWLSGGLQTSADCIVGGLGSVTNAFNCIKGISDFSTNVYDQANKDADINSVYNDGCLTGTWSMSQLTCQQGETSYSLPAQEIYMSQRGSSVSMSGGSYDNEYYWNASTLERSVSEDQSTEGMTCTSTTTDTWTVSNCQSAQIVTNTSIKCSTNSSGVIPPATLRCTASATKK